MEQLFRERVCGIDVGKASITACVRVPGPPGQPRPEVTRTFGTTTAGLMPLVDWMLAERVQLVVMESTGVYWKPVFYALEPVVRCWLVNPKHVKNLPGRKTDALDAQWLAQLAENGLVRASFVPPPPIRELRNTTRYRAALVHERTREIQRLHALLEDAGIKLDLVASDITGASGTAMLQALIDGQTDPNQLAELAKGALRNKIPALTEALTGHFTAHHAGLAHRMLTRIKRLDCDVADIELLIAVQLHPFETQTKRLQTIPGVGEIVAAVIIAELGVDMTQFPTAAQAASWAGLCPGNNESAGRRFSGKTRKGDIYLRAALGEAAYVIAMHRGTYLHDSYHRIARRRGKKRAIVATARKLLEAAHYMLINNVDYQDLGPDFLTRRVDPARRAGRLVHELAQLGYTVTVKPAA